MKFVRTAVLVAALVFAGCGFAQEKKAVGYDLGSCSPGSFLAVHVEYKDEADITITEVSPGPDKVVKLEKPTIFKYAKTDKDGKHYAAVTGGRELVVAKADEKIFLGALVTDEGDVAAVVFGVPGDGSKLADNAKEEFGACMDLLKPEPNSNITTS
jgi:hypothetical protein